MEPNVAFEEFVELITQNLNYKQALLNYENQYNLKKYKFTGISSDSAILMFRNIVDKFYKAYGPSESGTWFQNELRIFLWVLICYMELYRKKLTIMKEEDWAYFAAIFYVKEKTLFQYQAKSLLDDLKQKWQPDEDNLLYTIIMKDPTSKWNQIAKQLFLRSSKKYLRTSKQCRERWLNHLDPNKTKCEWSLKQYLILFDQVEKRGKKWSLVVKALDNRRSQHSIKNKYNSIIRKQKKLTPQYGQAQICSFLIRKLTHMSQSGEYYPQEDLLFGSHNGRSACSQQNNEKFGKMSSKKHPQPHEIEDSKKKFLNFRKKLSKIHHPQRQVCSNILNTPHKTSPNSNPNSNPNPLLSPQLHPLPHPSSPPMRNPSSSTSSPLKQQQDSHKNMEQIFYQDSFDNVLMRPHENHLIFTEDLRNLIKECDL